MEDVDLPFQAGEVNFGEPGTNSQHSFYQLIHQGRVVPCDLGFCESQNPVHLAGEPVSNNVELMSNFFAQLDALARGNSLEDLTAEGVPEKLRNHNLFPGNRPSVSLLFQKLNAYSAGQLLALNEHHTVVQGSMWGLNGFDQWGAKLGKVLAKHFRSQLSASRSENAPAKGFNSATASMLEAYLAHKSP